MAKRGNEYLYCPFCGSMNAEFRFDSLTLACLHCERRTSNEHREYMLEIFQRFNITPVLRDFPNIMGAQ